MNRIILLFLLCVLTSATAFAQVTTSSLMGTVKDAAGAPSIGATVQAKHEPTGAVYGVAANSDGRYNIQNMRVGGPYTVTISFVGARTETFSNVSLQLGQPAVLNATLQIEGTALNEVTVTAPTSSSIMNAERQGSVTNISTAQIERLPTISRSLNDFLRLTPQASSTSTGAVGGGNYRQNNITIDGSDFNNNFGIGTNLPAGGSPISLDAVQEISVNVTPFDVRQSNFIGSAVNAVTRSGTNEFSGSVYTYFRNQNQQGNKVGDQEFTKQNLDDMQFGFRLGGPLIKNKLFFFINAEKRNTTSPGQQNIASSASNPYGLPTSPTNIARPTETFLNDVSSLLKERYGYETGPYQNYSFVSNRTNILGRLDWNINNNNHFSIRYNQVESKAPSFVSTSRTPFAAYPFGNTARTSIIALPFSNSNYFQEQNFYSLAAELNSTVNSQLSNTFRATYTHQKDPRSSASSLFPFVDILDGTNNPTTGAVVTPGTNPLTSFGYEPFTFGNLRDVETYSVVDYVNITKGRNNITAGFQGDIQTTQNGFQRFGTSYYTFDSYYDFMNGQKPSAYAATYSLLPNYAQAFPRFKTGQIGVYAQDEYTVTDRLRVTVGLRAELNKYFQVDEIKTHPLLADLTFAGGEKFDTGVLPQNRVLLSPRVGFNYDVKGDRTLQVRGGSGIFAGRVPTVWLVAQSGDAGLLQFTTTATGKANTPGPFNPDPSAYRPATPPVAGTQIPGSPSSVSPDFRNPQTWKSSLAVDVQLPFGIVGTLEGIYNKDLTVALGRNINLVDAKNLGVSGYPDNRPIYPIANSDKYINPLTSATPSATNTKPSTAVATGDVRGTQALSAIQLYNAHQGYYWSATAKLEKRFNNGLSASVAYVRSDAKTLFDGGGDQLLNTWSGTSIVNNSNSPELSYANYVVPDRVVASLTYRAEYLKHLGTTVSMFYEGSSQGRFSYIYGGDFNRDGQSNDLIYIPRDASEITFSPFNYGTAAAPNNKTAQEQSELFFKYVDQDPYLSARKGNYAERNGAKLPWRSQFDFKLAQDIFTNILNKRNTLQVTLDIFNVGNFLNKNWGLVQSINASSILVPTNQAALVTGGTVKPTFRLQTDRGQPASTTFRDNNTLASTYYMQFGLRYIFN